MTLYERNLQSLFQVNAQLAGRLFSLQTNEKFEIYVDEKDPLNINIASNQSGKALYEDVPIRETESLLEHFVTQFQRYPYLYFFGMGNGVFYKALLQNEVHQRIVIVEPELEILYMALHFNDFTKEIQTRRMIIVLAGDVNFALASEIFMHPESRLFAKTYQFHTLLPFYESEYETLIMTINRIFLRAIEHAVRGLGNNSIDALVGLKHQVANIDKMVQTPTTIELIKKIKNSNTAIIISTGPSLKKQLPLLKTIKDHATLFCIDSSLPILEKEGIKPDVVVSLERVIETAKFYKETSQEFQEDIVFAITSIVHPDLFKEIKAGTLQISMRPFGYTSYFDMPEYGYIGIGMSAANMAFELVFHAHFENCIFIGQDLSYGADGSTHSDGHLYGATEKKVSKQVRYEVPAYGGDGVVETTLVWKLFKNFFEADIMHANARGMRVINSTEGGARIEGTREVPFATAIEQYVDFTHQKEQIIITAPDEQTIQKNLQKASTKIEHLLSYATKVQKDVATVFLHVATECEKIESISQDERYEKLDYQALADVMAEIDRVKELFDDQEFANIFTDSTQAMVLHQEINLATIQVRNVNTDNEKRQKMIDWVLAHRFWLFSLAGMMQATIDTVNMGLEMKIDFDTIDFVSVYVDGEEIDCLHVSHEEPFMKKLADIKKICLVYELDEKHQEKAETLKFYYANKEQTLKEEVHIPLKNDRNFTNFMFINSLESTLDHTRFVKEAKEDDAPLSIGLLPIEDFVENKEIIEAVMKIYRAFPEVRFKFICFKEQEKEMSKRLFSLELDRIDFIAPADIYELYQEIDMFIYDLEPLEEERLYAIRYILNSTKEVEVPQLRINKYNDDEIELNDHIDAINFAISFRYKQSIRVDVYIRDAKIDEIKQEERKIVTLFDLRQLCFDYQLDATKGYEEDQLRFVLVDEVRNTQAPIYLPSQGDEGYNEFVFRNSLEATIDPKRLENAYEKDAIGFLATEENLHDEDFVGYIKELMSRFPEVTFKAFCFSNIDYELARKFKMKYTLEIESSPSLFLNTLRVYIHNAENIKLESLSYRILKCHQDLVVLSYAKKLFNEKTLGDYVLPIDNFYLQSLIFIGIGSEDLEKYSCKYEIILNKYLINLCGRNDIDINDDLLISELKHFYYVELALRCTAFREKLFQLRKLHLNF